MIHLVEGPDGAGKTSFSQILATMYNMPLVRDRGRECIREYARYESRAATGSDYQRSGDGYILAMEQLSEKLNFVSDRGWPTTVLYYELNKNTRPPLPQYLAVRQQFKRRRSKILSPRSQTRNEIIPSEEYNYLDHILYYYVTAPLAVLEDRLFKRGEDVQAARLPELIKLYDDFFANMVDVGATVRYVDGTTAKRGDWK